MRLIPRSLATRKTASFRVVAMPIRRQSRLTPVIPVLPSSGCSGSSSSSDIPTQVAPLRAIWVQSGANRGESILCCTNRESGLLRYGSGAGTSCSSVSCKSQYLSCQSDSWERLSKLQMCMPSPSTCSMRGRNGSFVKSGQIQKGRWILDIDDESLFFEESHSFFSIITAFSCQR